MDKFELLAEVLRNYPDVITSKVLMGVVEDVALVLGQAHGGEEELGEAVFEIIADMVTTRKNDDPR